MQGSRSNAVQRKGYILAGKTPRGSPFLRPATLLANGLLNPRYCCQTIGTKKLADPITICTNGGEYSIKHRSC
jgi:hypothetical protein